MKLFSLENQFINIGGRKERQSADQHSDIVACSKPWRRNTSTTPETYTDGEFEE